MLVVTKVCCRSKGSEKSAFGVKCPLAQLELILLMIEIDTKILLAVDTVVTMQCYFIR